MGTSRGEQRFRSRNRPVDAANTSLSFSSDVVQARAKFVGKSAFPREEVNSNNGIRAPSTPSNLSVADGSVYVDTVD